MDGKVISIAVKPEHAEVYSDASPEERAIIEQALDDVLHQIQVERLLALARHISEQAEANSLTPEILEEILSDDGLSVSRATQVSPLDGHRL
jgi:hypothetical protein